MVALAEHLGGREVYMGGTTHAKDGELLSTPSVGGQDEMRHQCPWSAWQSSSPFFCLKCLY